MTDRESFHIAVLSDPDNNGPRLVYADYLDEQGNESDAARAELIRVQVELSRKWAARDDTNIWVLTNRQNDIIRDWPDRWRRPPCDRCGGSGSVVPPVPGTATHCPACDGKGSTHPLSERIEQNYDGASAAFFGWVHIVRWERGFAVVTCDLAELGQAVYSETIRVGDTSRYDQVWRPSPWALDCVRQGVSFDTGNAEQNRTLLKLTLNAVMEGAKV